MSRFNGFDCFGFSKHRGKNHTYFAGLDKNRRRSVGLMEGEDKSDLNQHEVAEGHSREHRRGFVCRTVSPKSPMGARDQGLITCGLERTRNLSLRKKILAKQFLLWPWWPRVGGEVQNVCWRSARLVMSDFLCGPAAVWGKSDQNLSDIRETIVLVSIAGNIRSIGVCNMLHTNWAS